MSQSNMRDNYVDSKPKKSLKANNTLQDPQKKLEAITF